MPASARGPDGKRKAAEGTANDPAAKRARTAGGDPGVPKSKAKGE